MTLSYFYRWGSVVLHGESYVGQYRSAEVRHIYGKNEQIKTTLEYTLLISHRNPYIMIILVKTTQTEKQGCYIYIPVLSM